MRSALAAAGTGAAAALCCLAIPLTVGIIGVADLAALVINLGIVAITASSVTVAWVMRTRSRVETETSGDGDG
jgi:hypothetical protein